jgi:Tol biopolymer transport system component
MGFDSGERALQGTTWSPDGRSILFWRATSAATNNREIWEYSLDRDEAHAVPGTQAAQDGQICQSCLAMSPRRRWLLYTASVDGVVDVYLRRNLETGPAVKVSSQGGSSAYWSADGGTIYYLAPSGAVMAVDVGETSLSTPRLVVASAFGLNLFGVADGGNLFLRTQGNVWLSQPLRLVVNWPRRVAEAARAP